MMKRWIGLLLLAAVVVLSGCRLWAETDYEREQRFAGESADSGTGSDAPIEPDTPAFVENWFSREDGDPATFPDEVGATDQQTVLNVAGWVDGFTLEPTGSSHQYRTTEETVATGGGDSSSLAWLAFHGCRENGIVNVSVEMIDWDDGSEEYVCMWTNAGIIYVLDGDVLVRRDVFLHGAGDLVYGFDDIDYWEYE